MTLSKIAKLVVSPGVDLLLIVQNISSEVFENYLLLITHPVLKEGPTGFRF